MEQLVDVIRLSEDENQPWMTSLYSTSPGMVVLGHANIENMLGMSQHLEVRLIQHNILRLASKFRKPHLKSGTSSKTVHSCNTKFMASFYARAPHFYRT